MGSSQSGEQKEYRPMDIQHGEGVPSGLVAVTGATGFIGSHVVKALLESGYNVRAVVRDPSNATKIAHLEAMTEAKEATGSLSFAQGDLLVAGSYDGAFAECDAVVHCAAVVNNARNTKDPMLEIVAPSVQGSVNVYDSVARHKSIKRVIHTSSLAAIQSYGRPQEYKFTESDWNTWSSVQNGDYYGIAKTNAEEVAHRRAEASQGQFDVVSINPSIVFGKCLTKAHSKGSAVFVRQLLFGNRQHSIFVNCCDVVDVARAHVEALRRPAAGGQRFLISGDDSTHAMRLPQLANHCKELYPSHAARIRANLHGGLLFNLAWYTNMSEFERQVVLRDIHLDNSRSKDGLGLSYRPLNETLRDTIDSMLTTGFVTFRN